jgi:hypothetical protein
MTDLEGLKTPYRAKEQASWQLRQPRQLRGKITMLCTLIANPSSLRSVDDFQSVSLWIVEVADGPPVAGLADIEERNAFRLQG